MSQTGVPLATIDGQKQQQQTTSTSVARLKPLPPTPLPPNLPCFDLFTGSRKDYLKIGVPLYEASIKGDWKEAKTIFDEYPELIRYSITENGETALHVAASAKGAIHLEEFVRNLVGLMTKEDLALQNKNYNTAFYLAAAAGNMATVKIMADKNRELLIIAGATGSMMPLYAAALFGYPDVVNYLYENSYNLSDDGWTAQNRGWLLEKCVENDMFDVALKMVDKRPEMRIDRNVLSVLATKPDAFSEAKPSVITRIIKAVYEFCGLKVGVPTKDSKALHFLRIVWDDIAEKPKQEIDNILRGPRSIIVQDVSGTAREKHLYSSRILFIAAELGNTKFLVELIRKYPDLIWKVNDTNQTIFHIAVKHRHRDIYQLLYEIGSMKDMITPLKDQYDNNMLHLVGKIDDRKRIQDVSGVALQMQRELLWFEEVKSIIPPSYRNRKNKDGLTPRELFSKEHKNMVSQGERWMKEIAGQCMVVAALVVTVAFAAPFAVPGGYNQDNGIPIFHSKRTFKVFIVADAISLFSSAASLLYMLLSVFTSRYAEHDFLVELPIKLIIGLSYLFLSITTMMIAFIVSFFILYQNGSLWMPILISVFASVPIILYFKLQFHLLLDIIRTTYGSRYLFRPKKPILYYENPKI